MEYEYCLALQNLNIATMRPEDVRMRLGWAQKEFERVNGEKEEAMARNVVLEGEVERMRMEVAKMEGRRHENRKLRGEVKGLRRRVEELEGEGEKGVVERMVEKGRRMSRSLF